MHHLDEFGCKNFMALKAFFLAPKGLTVIGGENEQGKTTAAWRLLDVVFKGPKASADVPVRRGEDKAETWADFTLDDGRKVKVYRTITKEGRWVLKVTTADGANFEKPQELLDRLFPCALVDPGEFARGISPADDRRRAETLRRITGIDTSELDATKKAAYDSRTLVGQDVKRLTGQLAGFKDSFEGVPDEEVPASVQPEEIEEAKPELLSLAVLNDELDRARATNESNAKSRRTYNEFLADLGTKTRAVQDVLDEIARLTALLPELEHQRDAAQAEMEIKAKEQEALIDIDEAEIKARIASAEGVNAAVQAEVDAINKAARAAATEAARVKSAMNQAINEKVRAKKSRQAIADELALAETTYKVKTTMIEEAEAAKAAMLAAVKLPVEGLSFEGDMVLFNGLPCNDKQLSSEQCMRIGLSCWLAENPSIDLAVVSNGALLDDKRLAMFDAMAREVGINLLVEDVGDRRATIVIEDGAVRTATVIDDI